MVEKAISQLGRKLAKWSAPSTPAVVDFFSIEKHESRLPRWIFENPDTPDGPIASLGVASLHGLFRAFWRTVKERKGAFVRTTRGRVHGNLHGRNVLLDVAGNVRSAKRFSPRCLRFIFGLAVPSVTVLMPRSSRLSFSATPT